MKGRVRLHAGGIPTSDVRLSSRGASERRTAPGRDIRDVGPDQGPRRSTCRNCSAVFLGPGSYCAPCATDREILRSAAAKLKAAGRPGVEARTQDGAAYAKVRKKAQAARHRLDGRGGKVPSGVARGPRVAKRTARSTPGSRRCSSCNLELPATGRCDTCEDM